MNLLLIVSLFFFISVFATMLRRNPLPRGNNSRNFLPRNRTDMVKGIAAVAIVIDHIAARSFDAAGSGVLRVYLKGLASMGGIGVILFFFISGFGSFQAMERAKNKTIWLVNHVVSIIIIYLLCYISHIITYEIVTAGTYPIVINDILQDWIHLRAALTTAWYVRIQLLAYVFLYVTSPVSKKNVRILLLILLCLGQSILFWRLGFTANWWKSTLCFSLGAAVAVYKREIYSLFVYRRKSFLIASVLVLPFSYVLSLKIDVYAVKVIANVFLCMSLVSLIELIMPKKNFYSALGKYSLHIYLVHVGLSAYFLADYLPTDKKVALTLLFTIIFTIVTKMVSDRLIRHTTIRT